MRHGAEHNGDDGCAQREARAAPMSVSSPPSMREIGCHSSSLPHPRSWTLRVPPCARLQEALVAVVARHRSSSTRAPLLQRVGRCGDRAESRRRKRDV